MQRTFGMPSKKAQLAVRFFTYGVMTISTVLLTILAIYYAMGYRFNDNLAIEQGGIIEFRTEPSNAVITLDGQPTGRQTPNRTFARAGEHVVTMRLQGYRDWSKNIVLQPGQLLWLDYVRFIPQSVTTSPVREFTSLHSALASPDHAWLLMQQDATSPQIMLADLSNDRNPTLSTLVIPDQALTKKDGAHGRLTLLSWDPSSRYILVRHDMADTHEFIRLDRADPAAVINISRQFNLMITDARFGANGGNSIFVQVGGSLRRIDIGANNVSAPFAEGLRHFSVYDNSVGFVAERDGRQIVAIYQDGKETKLAEDNLDKPAAVAVSVYARHTYLAYSFGGNGVVVRDPGSSQSSSTEFMLDPTIQWLQFSPKGRFVMGGSPTAWNGYDIETGRGYSTPGGFASAPQWLDDFHFWVGSKGMLRIAEFDGQNTQDITSVTSGFSAVLSPNEQAIISINKTPHGTFVLQTSRIVN